MLLSYCYHGWTIGSLIPRFCVACGRQQSPIFHVQCVLNHARVGTGDWCTDQAKKRVSQMVGRMELLRMHRQFSFLRLGKPLHLPPLDCALCEAWKMHEGLHMGKWELCAQVLLVSTFQMSAVRRAVGSFRRPLLPELQRSYHKKSNSVQLNAECIQHRVLVVREHDIWESQSLLQVNSQVNS